MKDTDTVQWLSDPQIRSEHFRELRDGIKARNLRSKAERAPTTARGVHHVALISSDVERTVHFFQELLGFPLTEMFENRDYPGSTHFFFDIGGGNALAYFDLPGLDLTAYREVLGGHHHLAISMLPAQWSAAVERLQEAGIAHSQIGQSSVYFNGPDGERLEIISDPLGEMNGMAVV